MYLPFYKRIFHNVSLREKVVFGQLKSEFK